MKISRQRRLLCLAASHFQVPLIQKAKERGLYVITCDYLPDNPGHALADESHNVSTTDVEAVLALAREVQIDAVIAYASDPSIIAASYVAESLLLPGNPFAAIRKLAYKHEFRLLQQQLGVSCPRAQALRNYEELKLWANEEGFPLLVKPVDSSGSKGVVRVNEPAHLQKAFDEAMIFSRSKVGIVEKFVTGAGPQIHGDAFVVDGRVAFACLGDHHFASIDGHYTPVATTIPSQHPDEIIKKVICEVDLIISGAGYINGPVNIEARVDQEGRIVIIEIGPRNGGNFVPQLVEHATGADMVGWCLKAALGEPIGRDAMVRRRCAGFYSYYILHSTVTGHFAGLIFSQHIKDRIIEITRFKKLGDFINAFVGSHATIGVLLLKYKDRTDMLETLKNIREHVQVRVEKSPLELLSSRTLA